MLEVERKVMRPASVKLMQAFAEAYAVRDLDRSLACFPDEVISALHCDRDMDPFAGVTIGRSQRTKALRASLWRAGERVA